MKAPTPFLFFDNDKLNNPLFRLKLIIRGLKRAENSRERERLYEIARHLFTDETHYMIFRYVPITENTEVYEYEGYIALRHKYRRKVSSWRGEREVDVRRAVLIGINDDGKLFANIIEPRELDVFEDISEDFEFDFRQILGFHKDYSHGEVIFLPDNAELRLRVQGEIIFTIRKRALGEVIEDYVNLAKEQIRNRLYQAFRERIARDIIRELSLLRISGALGRNRWRIPDHVITIIIETTRPSSWDKDKEIKENLERIMAYVLKRICENEPLISPEHFGPITVISQGRFGDNRYQFIIDIHLYRWRIMDDLEKFMDDYNEVFEQLRETLDFVSYTYERGNHIIMAKSLPHEVTITFYNPISERDETVMIRIPEQIIFTCEDITIIHDEHGETNVKLLCEDNKVYEIEVGETVISERDRLIRNRIVIELLGKKLLNKAL